MIAINIHWGIMATTGWLRFTAALAGIAEAGSISWQIQVEDRSYCCRTWTKKVFLLRDALLLTQSNYM